MSQKTKFTKAKLLILGDERVGKTAFAVRYITKRFIGEYDADKEMLYTYKAMVDKEEISLDLLDTAAMGDESTLEGHIRWADGYVLMYSVTDRTSLQRILYLHSLICHVNRPHDDERLPMVLVGNKTDQVHARQLTTDEGMRMGRRLDCDHFELSVADSPEGATQAMETLLRMVKTEFLKALALGGKRATPFTSVKRVFKKKMYRSRSDTLQ